MIDNKVPKDEIWRPVQYVEDLDTDKKFEISNYGRLRTFNKKLNDWKVLKASMVRGYKAYCFKIDKSTTKLIHRLVAEAFVDRDSEMQNYVIHLDYNKLNNKWNNLRWVTKDTMFAHHKLNPNYNYTRKRRITNSKLTETDVIRLKKKLKRSNNPLYKIAKEFGITHTQLNRIRSGENWGHIKVD